MLEGLIVEAGLQSSENYKAISVLFETVVEKINNYWSHDIFLPCLEWRAKFREIDRLVEEILAWKPRLATEDVLKCYYEENADHIFTHFQEMATIYEHFRLVSFKKLSL